MRINLTNDDKIRDALASVNGTATAHTLTSASDIAPGLAMAESELKRLGLRKPQWKGAIVTIHSKGPSAKAYKYAAIGTSVRLERGASGWFMIEARRINLYRHSSGNNAPYVSMWLQDCHRHAAIEALRYRIKFCYRVGA
jgi:hypothetical protein